MDVQKRILVVDDDPDFVEAVGSFLEANGFAVFRAYDGAEGTRMAAAAQPDLILMDIVMGERTEGFWAIQEIRRNPALQSVPVFVVSALCSNLPEFQTAAGGGWLKSDMFFAKPVDTGQLLEKIRQRFAGAG